MWPSSYRKGTSEDSYSVCTWKNQIFLQSMWPSSYNTGKPKDTYSVCSWKNQIFLQSMWPSIYRKEKSEEAYSVYSCKNQIFLKMKSFDWFIRLKPRLVLQNYRLATKMNKVISVIMSCLSFCLITYSSNEFRTKMICIPWYFHINN